MPHPIHQRQKLSEGGSSAELKCYAHGPAGSPVSESKYADPKQNHTLNPASCVRAGWVLACVEREKVEAGELHHSLLFLLARSNKCERPTQWSRYLHTANFCCDFCAPANSCRLVGRHCSASPLLSSPTSNAHQAQREERQGGHVHQQQE